jgi:chromosome segregation ATPase
MNAVMKNYEVTEDANMPAAENNTLAIEVAELRSDVRHIQSDVSDIKASLRVTDQRLESVRKEAADRFDKSDQKLESFKKETDQKLESLRKETAQGFDSVKESLTSAKLWALGLYIALAGSMYYVMARGFKWL